MRDVPGLSDLFAGQFGLATRAQLRDLGVSAATLRWVSMSGFGCTDVRVRLHMVRVATRGRT